MQATAKFRRSIEAARKRAARGKLFFVYLLIDPNTKAVRYVGCCSDLASRYAQHLNPNLAARRVEAWVSSVFPAQPLLEVVATFKDIDLARSAERETIRELVSAGSDLLNVRERLDKVVQDPPNRRFTLRFKKPSRGYRCASSGVAALEQRLRREAFPEKAPPAPPREPSVHIAVAVSRSSVTRSFCGLLVVRRGASGLVDLPSKYRSRLCDRCVKRAKSLFRNAAA